MARSNLVALSVLHGRGVRRSGLRALPGRIAAGTPRKYLSNLHWENHRKWK